MGRLLNKALTCVLRSCFNGETQTAQIDIQLVSQRPARRCSDSCGSVRLSPSLFAAVKTRWDCGAAFFFHPRKPRVSLPLTATALLNNNVPIVLHTQVAVLVLCLCKWSL